MMKMILKHALVVFAALLAVSCVENDLSYPNVTADFTSFEVEGQKTVNIDPASRTVEIVLNETADISRLKVLGYTMTEGASVVGDMPDYLDLSSPVQVVLRVYKNFEWTIKAVQTIERYIKVDNQVGEGIIDPETKSAYVYVSENQSLLDVVFRDMKLEPEGSVILRTLGFVLQDGKSVPVTEDCKFPMTLDCVIMRYFFVQYQGQEIKWSVKVLQKAVEVEVESVNPWAYFAGVSGMTNGEGTPSVEYRKSSDSEWIAYQDIEVDGTNVKAVISGLEPETDYVVRITNGVTDSAEKAFRTEAADQLENFSYDSWYIAGKAWMPNKDENIQIWDTANPGSAGLGLVPTVPEENVVVNGKAVKMVTEVAPIINMLAAGNIYTGKFDKLAGLGAELDWGVPFGARPLALRGYYKYTPQIINVGKDPDYAQYMGQLDQCQIQIFLAEWDKPFHVNSAKKQFVDRNDKSVIAFSEFYTDEENAEYKQFTLPIVYNDNRIPTYIVISACASRFGNFFVGGVGSLLYIDEFELVYDPDELTPEEYEAVFSKVKPF